MSRPVGRNSFRTHSPRHVIRCYGLETHRRGGPVVTENILAPLKLRHTRFLNPQPGNYKTIPNQTENYIFVVANGAPRELKAESPAQLFYDDESDRQIEFVFDKQGVKAVRFISQGLVTELRKLH
jgi:hypothetical protein